MKFVNSSMLDMFNIDYCRENNNIIVHPTNSLGIWGKGFCFKLGNKWSLAKKDYMDKCKSLDVGNIVFTMVRSNLYICSLLLSNTLSLKYNTLDIFVLENSIKKLNEIMSKNKLQNICIHIPSSGCKITSMQTNFLARMIQSLTKISNIIIYDK